MHFPMALVKRKQQRRRIELGSPIPFPMTITVAPRVALKQSDVAN